jgi:hypothetical protein
VSLRIGRKKDIKVAVDNDHQYSGQGTIMTYLDSWGFRRDQNNNNNKAEIINLLYYKKITRN